MAASRSAAEVAQREAERWRAKAAAAERRAGAAERKLAAERAGAQRLVAERDEARRLLKKEAAMPGTPKGFGAMRMRWSPSWTSCTPELEKLRKELSKLRLQVRQIQASPW